MGRRCPAPLPAHLRLASPAASTGNNRGPQRPPMQALLRSRPGREGGHCRSLFRFPQHCLCSKRPLGANKASPKPAAVRPPSARPWGRAHQAPGLLKWQVQGGNEVMSKLWLGGRLWARAGHAGEQTDGHWDLCLHTGQPRTRPSSRGLNPWTESMSKAPRVQQRNQRKAEKENREHRTTRSS